MKRIIDYDAVWLSDRLGACQPEFRYEYLWLYGLADARGSFELQTPKKIHHRVSAIRPDLTEEKIEAALKEFTDNGLLFIWEVTGKRYGHWVGSTKPGRLPTKAQRDRSNYKVETPPVPLAALKDYCEEHSVSLSYWPEGGEAEPVEAAEIATAENVREFTDYAIQAFTERFHRKPSWKQHEYIQFARLRKSQELTLEAFRPIWDAYISDDDPWVKDKNGHSLACFCSKFDAYANRVGSDSGDSGPSEEEKGRLRAEADRQLEALRAEQQPEGEELDSAAADGFFGN